MKTIFQTPGNFDLMALDTMGLNVKPNSKNPIGYFGTGLKYAIAVLLREGAKINLYCNGDHYEFYTDWDEFRGESFKRAFVKRTNFKWSLESKVTKLPFTIEFGKNWMLWQAFRELYANTLDENGTVFTYDDDVEPPYSTGEYSEGFTWIVIDHLEFSRLVDKRDQIFLPQERELVIDANIGNVTAARSSHLYYRGMRAFDLPEEAPAMFTWNIIEEQELTEDRTIKSQYGYAQEVKDLVIKSKDKTFIKAVLTAPEKSFEKTLDFSYAFSASDEFKEVITENRDHQNISPSALRYYGTYVNPPKASKCSDDVWELIKKALNDARSEIAKHDKDESGPSMTAHASYDIYLKHQQRVMER